MGNRYSFERELIDEFNKDNLEDNKRCKQAKEKFDKITYEIQELERENKIKKESLNKK